MWASWERDPKLSTDSLGRIRMARGCDPPKTSELPCIVILPTPDDRVTYRGRWWETFADEYYPIDGFLVRKSYGYSIGWSKFLIVLYELST